MQKQQHKNLLITLSELGSFICTNNEARQFPVAVRDIVDVSGAGDTVISVASLAMAVGLPPATITQMSNLAGGLVCSKLGVTPIDRQQLINDMQRQNIY